jgi:hypothetical protein
MQMAILKNEPNLSQQLVLTCLVYLSVIFENAEIQAFACDLPAEKGRLQRRPKTI